MRYTSAVIIFTFIFSSCQQTRYDFIQAINSPNEKYNFCLYASNRIKAQDFIVLRLEEDINPNSVKINLNTNDVNSDKNAEWVLSRQVLSNYEESSNYSSNPKIELINNRLL